MRREVYGQPWAVTLAVLESLAQSCKPEEFKAGWAEELAADMAWDGALEVQGGVAVIRVENVIVKRPSLMKAIMGGVCLLGNVQAMFDAAITSDEVSAICFCFDSPGGTVSGVPELATHIFEARQRTDRPVVGCVDGMCCSAAWWLGAQLDALYISEASVVGSMSVISTAMDPTRMYKNAGIDVQVFASNSMKTGSGPEWERSVWDQIARYHGMFVAAVARGRGISEEASAAMADARVYIGSDAVAAGFGDAVGTLAEVVGRYGK